MIPFTSKRVFNDHLDYGSIETDGIYPDETPGEVLEQIRFMFVPQMAKMIVSIKIDEVLTEKDNGLSEKSR